MRYTNFILTVIALCMLYQCAKISSVPGLSATAPVKLSPIGPYVAPKVQSVRVIGQVDVNVAGVYGRYWTEAAPEWKKGTLPISMENPSVQASVLNAGLLPLFVHVANPNAVAVTVDDPVEVSGKVEISNRKLRVEIDQDRFTSVPVEVKNLLPIDVRATR